MSCPRPGACTLPPRRGGNGSDAARPLPASLSRCRAAGGSDRAVGLTAAADVGWRCAFMGGGRAWEICQPMGVVLGAVDST